MQDGSLTTTVIDLDRPAEPIKQTIDLSPTTINEMQALHCRTSVCAGPTELRGPKPSYALMTECDTLLMIGSEFHTPSSCLRRARRAALKSTTRRGDKYEKFGRRLPLRNVVHRPHDFEGPQPPHTRFSRNIASYLSR
jgi:hypothetical protein